MIGKGVASGTRAPRQGSDSRGGESHHNGVVIRLLEPRDSFRELTDLLHLAFKSHGQDSHRYPASEQNEETTRQQTESGQCWVAEYAGRLIGLGIVWPPGLAVRRLGYRPGRSAYLSQLAVHPDFQGQGVGTILLNRCEQSAAAMDALELVGSSPAHSRQLALYYRLGYGVVKYVSRSDIDCYSVLFSKWIAKDQRAGMVRQIVQQAGFYRSFLGYKLGLLGCRQRLSAKILQGLRWISRD